MNPSKFIPAAILLLSLAATTPARSQTTQPPATAEAKPKDAAPESAAAKWLAQTDAQFQAAYDKQALQPYKDGAEEARRTFLSTIESALTAAIQASNTADTTLYREEKEKFLTNSRTVPASDSDTSSALIRTARAKLRTQLTALERTRLAAAKPIHSRYDALLAQNYNALRQRQLNADAALLAAKREDIAKEWLASNTDATPAKEEKTQPLTHLGLEEGIKWLLQSGGSISYKSGKSIKKITSVKAIPSTRVEFRNVTLSSRKMKAKFKDSDLDNLAPLRDCDVLTLNSLPVADNGLRFLEAWKSLESFTLTGADVTDKLSTHLARFPTLKTLNLSGCTAITGELFHQLKNGLPKLETLNLSACSFNDDGLTPLAPLRNLSSLTLSKTEITDKGIPRLATMHSLRSLYLNDTAITTKGLAGLAPLRGLETLGFLSTDSPDFAETAQQIAKLFPRIEGLRISGTELTAAHIEALQIFKGLKSLDLGSMEIKPEAAAAIGKFHRLEKFSTESPEFSDENLSALLGLHDLQILTITHSKVTDTVFAKLKNLKKLKAVHAIDTPVTEEAADALKKAFKALTVDI